MKFSKILAVIFALCVICFNAGAQQSTVSDSVSVQQASISNPALIDESTIPIASTPQVQAKRPSTFWVFFRMILVLGFVVVCIYFVMHFVQKKFNFSPEDESFLRKVAAISLEPGRTVYVVTLLDKGYIIGSTASSMNLISEIDDKELVDAMNLNADKREARTKARNFSDVLEMFMPSKGNARENVYNGSTKNMADFINAQRNRMKEEE